MREVRDLRNTREELPKILVNNRPHFARNGLGIPVPNDGEIKEFRRALPQFLAVGVKNILLFVYGMTLGFPTIVIPAIQGGEGREPSDIILNRDQISWFSSINLICVPLGCVFSGIYSQPIGKKKAMQIVNLPIIASWLCFHFSTSIEYLYVGLFLSGLSGGLMEAPVLTYVAEITEPKYRGLLSASGSACVIMGIFIQFILGSILDWRTISAVSTVFPVISIVTLFFIPESPVWLIRQNRFPEAIKSLQWLRGWVPEHRIEDEFNRLYDELIVKVHEEELKRINSKQSAFVHKLLLFKKRSFLLPFILILFTFFVGHFSGKTALQTYAVQIFHTLKAPIDKYHATILLGMAELIGTILCVVLIHFTGKRPLVFLSTIGCGICFFGTATYAYFVNVVPGFAVSNVVTNVSSILPKDSIITTSNITEIFKKEEQELQEKAILDAIEGATIATTIFPREEDNFTEDEIDANSTEENFSVILIQNNSYSGENDDILIKRNADNEDILTDNFDLEDFSEKSVESSTIMINEHAETSEIVDSNDDKNYEIEMNENVFNETDDYDYLSTENATDVTTEILTTELPDSGNDDEEDDNTEEENSPTDLEKNIFLPIPKLKKNKYLWLPLILLLGAAFFAHVGIRLIPWMLIGEVFPVSIRGSASGLAGGVGYIFGFLANKLFLQMIASLTMPGTFWFYSGVALLGTIILYFVLPETEGVPLTEIERFFSSKISESKNVAISEEPQQSTDITELDSGIASLHNINSKGTDNLSFTKEEGNETTHL